MLVAELTSDGSAEPGVAPDPDTQELLVLLTDGGLAEVDSGEVAEGVPQRLGQRDRPVETGERGRQVDDPAVLVHRDHRLFGNSGC